MANIGEKAPFILRGVSVTSLAVCTFVLLFNTIATAQTAHQLLRKADKSYTANDYKQAEENYSKAQQAQRSSTGDYNLGNTIYQQQRYDDAVKQYDGVIAKTQDNQLKFNSLFNKGNAHFAKKEYDKSIESYKSALRMNPSDVDAKTNLALAQRMIQQQQQQQERDKKNQDKNKSNNDKDKQNQQNKDQQNKDQQNKDQQNQKPQDPNQQNKDKNQQNQNPQQNPQQNPNQAAQQEMKKEQARQILQIMDDEERKVQQRLRKGKPKPSRSSKDW